MVVRFCFPVSENRFSNGFKSLEHSRFLKGEINYHSISVQRIRCNFLFDLSQFFFLRNWPDDIQIHTLYYGCLKKPRVLALLSLHVWLCGHLTPAQRHTICFFIGKSWIVHRHVTITYSLFSSRKQQMKRWRTTTEHIRHKQSQSYQHDRFMYTKTTDYGYLRVQLLLLNVFVVDGKALNCMHLSKITLNYIYFNTEWQCW